MVINNTSYNYYFDATRSNQDSLVSNAAGWLKEVLQRKVEVPQQQNISHLPLSELNDREQDLFSFLAEQGLEEYREFIPTFLEAGLVRRDLESLLFSIKDATLLPAVLDFLNSILAIKLIAYGITYELERIFVLIDTIIACTQI